MQAHRHSSSRLCGETTVNLAAAEAWGLRMVDASSNRPKDLLYNCADQMVILSKSEPSAVYADLVWSEKDPAIAMIATHWINDDIDPHSSRGAFCYKPLIRPLYYDTLLL